MCASAVELGWGSLWYVTGTISNIPPGMVGDQFGMVGLLTFIRAAETDPNLVALAPGIDLTTLGLNLNSPEWVHWSCDRSHVTGHSAGCKIIFFSINASRMFMYFMLLGFYLRKVNFNIVLSLNLFYLHKVYTYFSCSVKNKISNALQWDRWMFQDQPRFVNLCNWVK